MSLKLEREITSLKKQVALLNAKYDNLHEIVEHKMVHVFEAIVREKIDIEFSRDSDEKSIIKSLSESIYEQR